MRLVEYLFTDPGHAPTPDSADNWHMARGREGEHGLPASSQVADQEPHRHGDPIARLDGGFYHLPSPFTQADAIRYRHVLGEGAVDEAPEAAGHNVQDPIDEVLKKGVQSHSAYDNRAIGKLTNGKYPGRSEDGKGFCFIWAEGRGICAFRYRGDALRWAKDEPRDIVKFWYGEPVSPSGKFRIRVRDRYRKDETVETFTAVLERRVVRAFNS